MRSPTGGGIRRSAVISTLTTGVLLSGLVAAGPALAGPDPMSSSSSVVLQLRSSGGLKLKPASLALPINMGALDPTTGAGTVETNKGFTARSKGRKAKVKITKLTFGANGGPGKMDAKIGKTKVKGGFAKLTGGTLTRDGWGAKLDGVAVKLSSKGAKALNRAFGPRHRGKASAAAGGIKGGKPLGTTSVNAVPSTVEVLPGGTLVFDTALSFAFKLAAHCVNGVPASGEPSGVQPIPPATQNITVFTFPVTGGSIAPDFSSGTVVSAGGQLLMKNEDASVLPDRGPAGCSAPPPLGTSITQTAFQTQFDIKGLAADALLPTGPLGVASLGTFNLAAPGASATADAHTRQVTITAAPVLLGSIPADLLNNTFPNGSGNPSFDFAPGDALGKISLTITTH
jgi:hypothetical protein